MKIKTTLLLLIMTLFALTSCESEKDERETWVGKWKYEADDAPNKSTFTYKASSGNITLDPSSANKILISKDLFGLKGNPFSASISGSVATINDTTEKWIVNGTGKMVSKNEIQFRFKIETEEATENESGKATRMS